MWQTIVCCYGNNIIDTNVIVNTIWTLVNHNWSSYLFVMEIPIKQQFLYVNVNPCFVAMATTIMIKAQLISTIVCTWMYKLSYDLVKCLIDELTVVWWICMWSMWATTVTHPLNPPVIWPLHFQLLMSSLHFHSTKLAITQHTTAFSNHTNNSSPLDCSSVWMTQQHSKPATWLAGGHVTALDNTVYGSSVLHCMTQYWLWLHNVWTMPVH